LTTIGSPASMIFSDDLEMLERCQQGLVKQAGPWVNFERGLDIRKIGCKPIRRKRCVWEDQLLSGGAAFDGRIVRCDKSCGDEQRFDNTDDFAIERQGGFWRERFHGGGRDTDPDQRVERGVQLFARSDEF